MLTTCWQPVNNLRSRVRLTKSLYAIGICNKGFIQNKKKKHFIFLTLHLYLFLLMIQLGCNPWGTWESRLAPFVILAGGLLYQQHLDSIVSWTEPKLSLLKTAISSLRYIHTVESRNILYCPFGIEKCSKCCPVLNVKTCCTFRSWVMHGGKRVAVCSEAFEQ